jgi:FkbM family methyltransferase
VQLALKRLVSRAGHGRSFLRRLPPDLGGCSFPASLEGGAKYLKWDAHTIDPVLTDFARAYIRPGHVVWDVGANVGLFTFAAAGLAGPAGRVVAIEADTWLVGNLRRAAERNAGRANVHVIPVAASDGVGVAQFHIARSNRATNYLAAAGGSSGTGGVRQVQDVPTLPLDALLEHYPAPDVLKIDVEGAEALVLAGASKVLSGRPVVLAEVYSEHSEAIARMLTPLGYRFLDAATGAATDLPSYNTIAVPVEGPAAG